MKFRDKRPHLKNKVDFKKRGNFVKIVKMVTANSINVANAS